MTKMAAMPIYGKNPSNIFFSETNRLISMKLGVKHPWLKYYNVYINHDPVMTLTKFMARSTWVAHAFEWEKLLKCHLKGKASKKLANGQNIDYSEKRKRPKGFICPCTGVKYHNIQTCLLVYAADSGERLQDHWSSGFILLDKCMAKLQCPIKTMSGKISFCPAQKKKKLNLPDSSPAAEKRFRED